MNIRYIRFIRVMRFTRNWGLDFMGCYSAHDKNLFRDLLLLREIIDKSKVNTVGNIKT